MKTFLTMTALAAMPFSALAAQPTDDVSPSFAVSAGVSSHDADVKMTPAFDSQNVKAAYNGRFIDAALSIPKLKTTVFASRYWGEGDFKDVLDGTNTRDNKLELDVKEFGLSYKLVEQLDPASGEGMDLSVIAGHRISDLAITDITTQSTKTDHSNFVGGNLSVGTWKGGWIDLSILQNLSDKDTSYGIGLNHLINENLILKASLEKEVFDQAGFEFDSTTGGISLSYQFF